MPKLRIPALSSLLKTITRQRPSPTQVLCNARSALLEDKSKLSQKHPLRRRIDKNNGALETIPLPRVPNHEHLFPPTLPKRSLRGLSRAVQRDRVNISCRKVVRSEAQDKLRESLIRKVEFRRWECREPKVLAGLGNTYMGPSADAPVETVELWVKAKAELKYRLTYDGKIWEFFEEQKLILVNPVTSLPLDWVHRFSGGGRPYFFHTKTREKQWRLPKGTDLYRFKVRYKGRLVKA